MLQDYKELKDRPKLLNADAHLAALRGRCMLARLGTKSDGKEAQALQQGQHKFVSPLPDACL